MSMSVRFITLAKSQYYLKIKSLPLNISQFIGYI
jgi:hypothetical protein